ncbi:MAG TPA: hypothetical protein VFI66_04800, partial [Gemmatimonadales bacterium]|nr:hypothetical protein [Gemmatimonadales bacterium]
DVTTPWFAEHAGADWAELRRETLELLQRDRELREIAELVGPEALLDADRLLLEVARTIRDTVLGQSAHDPNDALSSLEKTHRLAGLALEVYRAARRALEGGRAFEQLDLAAPRRALAALRRASAAEVPARSEEAQAAVEALAA